MLRAVVISLGVLAIAKLASQAYLYQQATENIIVATFKDRAILACARTGAQGPLRIPGQTWVASAEIELSIGKPDLDVALWQVNHRLWPARYKTPYLMVTPATDIMSVTCAYDVVAGYATVHRL